MAYVNVRDFAPLNGDWTPAFDGAISAALAGGHAGVFVPANQDPYFVRRRQDPGIPRPSIDLRGPQFRRFALRGEGDRSVIAMTGPGSWRLLHIGGQAADVRVEDLMLDGESLQDADQQSHLVVLGTSVGVAGGVERVSIVNCTLSHAAGDGIAIVPASSTATTEEVSDITIAGCRFLDNGRSGISNQRRGRRVSILFNHFAGSADQDIDFEPTGDLPETGPSAYLILGNTMVRRPGHPTCVTLSGNRPESPSRQNTFAYNRIQGGSVGLHDAHDAAIVGNFIEAGAEQKGTVLRVGGSVERLVVAGNTVVRTRAAGPGTLLNVGSDPLELSFSADDDVVLATNTLRRDGHGLQTAVGPLRASPAPGPGNAVPSGLSTDVDYWAIRVDSDEFRLAASPQDAQAGQVIALVDVGQGTFVLTRHGFPRSVRIQATTSSHMRTYARATTTPWSPSPMRLWSRSATTRSPHLPVVCFPSRSSSTPRVRVSVHCSGGKSSATGSGGDALLPREFDDTGLGSFDVGVSMAVSGPSNTDMRVKGNTFYGCATGVRISAESSEDLIAIPTVTGNTGAGVAVELQAVQAVLVDGNQQQPGGGLSAPVGARYAGPGKPGFAAPIGSLFSRSGGLPGPRLYVNTDGSGTGWLALV
jgi:hypothetical protein